MSWYRFALVVSLLTVGASPGLAAERSSSIGQATKLSKEQAEKLAKKKKKPNPQVEKKVSFLQAKKAFALAVELCEKPGVTDPKSRDYDEEILTMLEDREGAFMSSCTTCAKTDECEAERDRIKQGRASAGPLPCK